MAAVAGSVILSILVPIMVVAVLLPVAGALFGLGFWWSKTKFDRAGEEPITTPNEDENGEQDEEDAE